MTQAKLKRNISLMIRGNTGVANATLTIEGRTMTSDSNGDYELIVPLGWSGTITPSLEDYTFTPESKSYSSLNESKLDEDYVATPDYFIDSFVRANGDLSNDWSYTEGKWTISANKAMGTPGGDEEHLLNPGAEGTYADGLAPNWIKVGTPTVSEENVIVHSGSSSQKVETDSTLEGARSLASESFTAPVGSLFRASSWFYCVDSRANMYRAGNALEAKTLTTPSEEYGSWLNLHGTMRVEIADSACVMNRRANSSGRTIYIDDLSEVFLTMADLYALRSGWADVEIRTTLFDLAKYENEEFAGIAFRMDSLTDPQTGYVVYHNATKIILEKLTDGLWSKVGDDVNSDFVDGARLSIIANGQAVSTYYNGELVRTDTLEDYSSQTIIGLVSTYPNHFGYFQGSKIGVTVENQKLYVAKTGNDDTGDGTEENPYLTIAKAIEVAEGEQQWDEIIVSEGTYAETENSIIPNPIVSITGVGTVSTSRRIYTANSNTIINNFEFSDRLNGYVQLYHVESGYNADCEVKNISGYGVYTTRSNDALIEDVVILPNWATRGFYSYDASGVVINRMYVQDAYEEGSNYCFESEQDADDNIYTDCWAMGENYVSHGFIAKTSEGVEYHNCVAKTATHYTFYAKGATNGVMNHCVANDCPVGIYLSDNAGVAPYSAGWEIKNSVFLNCTTAIKIKDETSFTSDYNCFYGCDYIGEYNGVSYDNLAAWQAATGQDLHSVVLNPNYTSEDYGGYQLPEGSPLLTAGEDGSPIGLE